MMDDADFQQWTSILHASGARGVDQPGTLNVILEHATSFNLNAAFCRATLVHNYISK